MTEAEIITFIEENKPNLEPGIDLWKLNNPRSLLDFACSMNVVTKILFEKKDFNNPKNAGKHKKLIKLKVIGALLEIQGFVNEKIDEVIKRLENEAT